MTLHRTQKAWSPSPKEQLVEVENVYMIKELSLEVYKEEHVLAESKEWLKAPIAEESALQNEYYQLFDLQEKVLDNDILNEEFEVEGDVNRIFSEFEDRRTTMRGSSF